MTKLTWKEEKVICEMCLKSMQRQQGSRYMSSQLFLCPECLQEAKACEASTFTKAYQHDKNHRDIFHAVVPIMSRKENKILLKEYKENPLP